MLVINGSMGEGGGQILRTALALALVTGKPFRIERIRAHRSRPGLQRQHLAAVNAAAAIGHARVEGLSEGARALTFVPGTPAPGKYQFAVGTAGSTTLVLQTILPALLLAQGRSSVAIEGGTHNPLAPPYDFLSQAFLPVLNRMGPRVNLRLDRPGFYPAGGGCLEVEVEPSARLVPVDLLERGALRGIRARALIAGLPWHIAKRELALVRSAFDLGETQAIVEELPRDRGPANVLLVEVASENVTEVFTGFGEPGLSAENVARRVVDLVREYLDAEVPVGECLADQLLLPFAMAGGGSFRTAPLSLHARTNIDVIRQWLPVKIEVREEAKDTVRVVVGEWMHSSANPS